MAGYTGGGLSLPDGIAIDASGDAWVANAEGNSVIKLSPSGSVLSGMTGYTGGGLNGPAVIAIDGAGSAWVMSPDYGISEFSNTGVPLSPSTGYIPGVSGTTSIALDGSGDVWISDLRSPLGGTGASVIELIGAATPVVTPISVGVANNALGSRP